MTPGQQQRFMAKIDIDTNGGGCWEWAAFRRPAGYGYFACGREQLAHRVSYRMFHGPIPDQLCVLHRCDNRGCVNPAHLVLGTQDENIADMVRKGRQRGAIGDRNASRLYPDRVPRGEMHQAKRPGVRQGERNGRHVLTSADVEAIRSCYTGRRGEASSLARRFGVAASTVMHVVNRTTWAFVAAERVVVEPGSMTP